MGPSTARRRCIFCHQPLPANDAVEHFPLGKRVAFDPGRGRLWAVCPSCGRWNLAPFEDRWEALEELEKARRDSGRVLASTENIALIQVPGVEVVRVGDARLAHTPDSRRLGPTGYREAGSVLSFDRAPLVLLLEPRRD